MELSLTFEQVLNLAPDESSAKAGKELAVVHRWMSTGAAKTLVWGECSGSSAVYQTCADIADNAYKCTCPSRKAPCKHLLGLLLLRSSDSTVFAEEVGPPPWAQAWVEGKGEQAQKRQGRQPGKSVDREAQAKRAAKRTSNVVGGICDLERWLEDAVGHGLAELQAKSYQFWENQAARLVDAQAPGLARMVRDCAGIASGGADWQERLLRRLTRMHLLVAAYKRIDSLPEDLQAEVRSLIGYNFSQEEVLSGATVTDTWFVVGQFVDEDEKLRTRRTWLIGIETRRPALVLSFAYGTAFFDANLLPGNIVDADLAFYPGLSSVRALVKNLRGQTPACSGFPVFGGVPEVFSSWSRALAINPWTELYPVSLSNVRLVPLPGAKWELQDEQSYRISVEGPPDALWGLLAASDGLAVDLFGEWNGRRILPYGVNAAGTYLRFNSMPVK